MKGPPHGLMGDADMSESPGEMTSVRGSHVRRWAVTTLFIITFARVWLPSVTEPAAAEAQIPDAGAQRVQLVEEARRTNEILTEIRDILRKEPLQVIVRSADNQSEEPRRAP